MVGPRGGAAGTGAADVPRNRSACRSEHTSTAGAPVAAPARSTQDTPPAEGCAASQLPFLARFPNTLFSVALGLAGSSVLWRTIASTPFTEKHLGSAGNWVMWTAGVAVTLLVTVTYAYKACFHRDIVYKEWCHPVRVYFFNGPHVCMLMLCLGCPEGIERLDGLRVGWALGFVVQLILSEVISTRWLFSQTLGLGVARPQYLLATIGWMLLAALSVRARIREAIDVHLAPMLLGTGAFFYTLTIVSIVQQMPSASDADKASPALFLIFAPPSVAAVALAGLDGGFKGPSCAILGFSLMLLLILSRTVKNLVLKPSVAGIYWAFVFPLAALANTCVVYADAEQSRAAEGLAWAMIGVASLALGAVLVRMSHYHWRCMLGKDRWRDPLVEVDLGGKEGRQTRCFIE